MNRRAIRIIGANVRQKATFSLLIVAGLSFFSNVAVCREAGQQDFIRNAQQESFWGEDPKWISWSGDEAYFRQVRDAGYRFCLNKVDGDVSTCFAEQDEAVHGSILTLLADMQQREMPDRSGLSREQRWVASHPEIATEIKNYCTEIYRDHGSEDARILAVCLGNLPAFSPYIGLPVE